MHIGRQEIAVNTWPKHSDIGRKKFEKPCFYVNRVDAINGGRKQILTLMAQNLKEQIVKFMAQDLEEQIMTLMAQDLKGQVQFF